MDRPPVKNGKETERVLCIDRKNGKKIWEFIYPAEYKNWITIKGPGHPLLWKKTVCLDWGRWGMPFVWI